MKLPDCSPVNTYAPAELPVVIASVRPSAVERITVARPTAVPLASETVPVILDGGAWPKAVITATVRAIDADVTKLSAVFIDFFITSG
jgi:hypothetical protein